MTYKNTINYHHSIKFVYVIIFSVLLMWTIPSDAQSNRQAKYYHGTSLNPLIQAMVDSVSTDSLRSYILSLQEISPRHTVSDTVAPDSGIGAARRWIKSKYEQWRNNTGGALQPEFFWFTETICGMTGLHANVMATLPGTLPQAQNRHFIVSGHMDSRTVNVCDAVSPQPAANDDGSGTAASIELARIMSRFQFDATLIFMAVTGEEQGLFGSGAYASWAASNNMRIDGMLTNDIIGNIVAPDSTVDSTSVRHFSVGPSTSPSRQLARYIKLKGEQYVPQMTVTLIPAQDRPGRGGDHIAFNDNGYAAARFTEPVERLEFQHTARDSIQHMSTSYTARITKLSIAAMASMALAPETPQGALRVRDVGNGTELRLSWAATNTEPDFDGYRVAWRFEDSLFYQAIEPAGNVTEFTLSGLTPNQSVYVSYSALDTDGNESIFSAEVLATPRSIPATPQAFTATSRATEVQLSWQSNNELDLAGYRITRIAPDSSIQTFSVDTSVTSFDDNTAQPQTLYRYFLQAEDADGNLSTPTAIVRGQLATHDLGILMVDATKDGDGSNPLSPTDQAVDNYYDNLLADFNIAGQWDIADSMQQQRAISDADLAVYSTVIWHSDVQSPANLIAADTTALRKYLQNGGNLILSGWQIVFSASNITQVLKTFQPGHFVYDVMKIDTAETGITNDFRGADAVTGSYPSITVDSLKIPTFGGDLILMEALTSLVGEPQTELLHTYRSSQQPPSRFHGLPVSHRHLGTTYGVIVLDFPLFYMEEAEARQIITRALLDLGEVTGIGDQDDFLSSQPKTYALSQNFPNPFNPTTGFRYRLPKTTRVKFSIYTILGQQVVTLVDRRQSAGSYTVEWDGKDHHGKAVASGVYLYRLEAGKFVKTRKLVLIR